VTLPVYYPIPQEKAAWGFRTESPAWVSDRCKKCGWAVVTIRSAGHEKQLDLRPQHTRRVEGVWEAESHGNLCEKRGRAK
jgi:hypothetical protein